MRWLLLLPLLLAACGPSAWTQRMDTLERDIVTLQAQYRDLQAKSELQAAAPGALYYELVLGSFTSIHAYGAFSSYETAAGRVVWLTKNGYMEPTAPYFIQPRRLDDPLVVLEAGGQP